MEGGPGSAGSYLRDDGELRTQVMEANVCHVEPINADLTLCGLQDSEQAESHRRLASPGTAHDAYLWAWGGPHVSSNSQLEHPGSPHRGCGNGSRYKYLLSTLHTQSQVPQHQLEAWAVPHGIVPELHLPTCGPAFRSTAALNHPGSLAGGSWVLMFTSGLHHSSPAPATVQPNSSEIPGSFAHHGPLRGRLTPRGSVNPYILPLFFFLKMEPWASHMPGKHATAGPHPQPFSLISSFPPPVLLQKLRTYHCITHL